MLSLIFRILITNLVNRNLLALILSIIPFISKAQSSQHVFGEGFGTKIIGTSDGGFAVTGELKTPSYSRCFMLKFDSTSTPVILKTYYDLLEFFSFGIDMKELPGEGYLVARTMYHDTLSNYQVSLVKTNTNGDRIWSKTFGSSAYDDEAGSVDVVSNGYIVGGYNSGFGNGGEDFFLVKTDTSGQIQWSKVYGTFRDEHGVDALAYQNGIAFTGYAQTSSSGVDIFVLYIDSTGAVTTTMQLSAPADQQVTSMSLTGDGGLVISGSTNGVDGPHALIIKLSSAHQVQWARTLPDLLSTSNDVRYYPGEIIMSGKIYHQTSHENSYVLRLDTLGNMNSQEYFGDSAGCIISSAIKFNDTIISTGSFVKPSNNAQGIYLNKYYGNDSTCFHYNENFSLQTFTVAVSSATWQTTNAAMNEVNSVIAVNDPLTTDSNVCDLTPSTHDIDFQIDFSLYPNPATNRLTVELISNYSHADLKIFNLQGKIVLYQSIYDRHSIIDLSNFTAGIYSVELQTPSGKSVRKLIVE